MIFSNVVINDDLHRVLQDYFDEKDFSKKINILEIPFYEVLNLVDFNITYNLERMIMNYDQMNSDIKNAINICNLSMAKTLKKCNETFPKEGCFLSNSFVATKNCP